MTSLQFAALPSHLLKLKRPRLSRPPRSGRAHSSHGICCRNRDLGRQCRARVRVRASLSPAFSHQLHPKSRSAWCFCGIFLRGSCLITRNKHSADDPETSYILLFC